MLDVVCTAVQLARALVMALHTRLKAHWPRLRTGAAIDDDGLLVAAVDAEPLGTHTTGLHAFMGKMLNEGQHWTSAEKAVLFLAIRQGAWWRNAACSRLQGAFECRDRVEYPVQAATRFLQVACHLRQRLWASA